MSEINVQDLAEQIAAHLPGWQARPQRGSDYGHCRYATIKHDGGGLIQLYYDSYRKHVSCSGRYPERNGRSCSPSDWGVLRYSEAAPAIKFSPTREPKALARDIERRFLAKYLPLFAACQSRKGEHEAAEEDRSTYLARYAAACGGKVRGEKIHLYCEDDGMMGDVQVQTDGGARIDVWVPADKAEKIMQILGS